MSWQQPGARHGRTAVFLLVVAIFVATALAITLVARGASQSSGSSDDVLVLGPRVTHDTSAARPRAGVEAEPTAAPVAPPGPATPGTMLTVPRIGLHAPVHEDPSDDALDAGPGHGPGTAAPGADGNVVISGHRSTSDRSFERIGELEPGDAVVVGDATGTYTYVVAGSEVVAADRLDLSAPAGAHDLTLLAPHPPGTEQYRYVVRAELVSPPRPPGA